MQQNTIHSRNVLMPVFRAARFRGLPALVVFLFALGLRTIPVTSESFQYDAIVSQLAARAGPVANALDRDQTYRDRRAHPPLLSYFIEINNRLMGNGPWRARVYSMMFGALACAAVVAGVTAAIGTTGNAVVWSLFAGLLLAMLPVHLYISRTADWDAVYSFFSTLALVFLARYCISVRRGTLILALISATLALLTCELAVVLAVPFALALLSDLRSHGRRRVLRAWGIAIGVAVVVFIALWPAGVTKLHLATTLRFRFFDSATGPRNLPWTAFYTTLFRQSPSYVLAVCAGLFALAIAAVTDTGNLRKESRSTSNVPGAVMPFIAYAITVFVLSLRQRLVYIHHIADLFPSLTIVAAIGWAVAGARLHQTAVRRALFAVAIALLAGSVIAARNPDPGVVGPQETPGFIGISSYLANHPGTVTYSHFGYEIQFYAPNVRVVSSPVRHWRDADTRNVFANHYDYVVLVPSLVSKDFATREAIERVLAPAYRRVKIIRHRRTGKDVAWILGRR